MSAKYKVGNLVEFVDSSYEIDEFGNPVDDNSYYELSVNERYKKGQQGYVISIAEVEGNYIYKVQAGLTDIINIPESHLTDPNASIRSKVEERLREKQETKTFRDTEGRIGGSKKEKAAWRLEAGKVYTLDDLINIEDADEKLAVELIKKDTVYPKVDANIERGNGVSAGAAFLKIKLRESYPSKVPTKSAQRKIYVGYAEYLYKKTVDVYNSAEFEKEINNDFIKETVGIFIRILRPDLEESIKENKEKNELLLIDVNEKIQTVEREYLEEGERLQNKYPEFVKESYPYFDLYSVPEHDREKYISLRSELSDLKDERAKYQKDFNDIEKEFIKSISPSLGRYYSDDIRYVSKLLIKEVFGSTFLNFLTKGSEAAAANYELAKQYEALSETESEILIEEKTKYDVSTLAEYKKQLGEMPNLINVFDYDSFFSVGSRGSTGYHQSVFGESYKGKGKWYFYNDLKSFEYKKKYADRYFNGLKQSIARVEKKIEETKEKYKQREDDWSWALKEKSTGEKTKKKAEIKVNTYPPLTDFKRIGGYLITEDNITPVTIEKGGIKFNDYPILKNNFGFKDVEFGQSLKDTEAKIHIKHFLGAMADLGDILDLNIKKLNELGGLSIAFASRGGGKASAHYESLRKVINITKTKGGGSVAHEYAHYIDNIIPFINRVNYEIGDWASVKDNTYKSYYGIVQRKIQNQNVSKAVTNIFKYIEGRQMPDDRGGSSETGKNALAKIVIPAYTEKTFQIPAKFMDNSGNWFEPKEIEEYFELFKKRYTQYRYIENLKQRDKQILGNIVNRYGLKEYAFEFESKTSQYLANSNAMSSDYWSRDWELFARAFEVYIFDKLAKANRANGYLVKGWYFSGDYGVYPQGEERENLFILYDKFIDVIKEEYGLAGFVSWTTERVDEYYEVDTKTDEEDGVVVDNETGETVEVFENSDTLKPKLRELLALLKEEKMELGGVLENSEYFDKLNDYLITL